LLLKPKIKKKFGVILLIITISIFTVLPLLLPINFTSNNEQLIIKPSGETHYTDVLWLDNPTFEDPITPWYNTTEGDASDINAITDLNQANYKILGDSGVLQVDDALNSSDWSVFRNPRRPILPDTYSINSAGAEIYHYWDEQVNQTRNTPSIHWKRNIEMPVNMSDYIITSASLEVVFNATVTVMLD
jgi:hypothetical protein